MKKQVLVTVIMCTHNDEKYIAMAIDSVLMQTYSNFEFIIINDASTDRTPNIILDYCKKDSRIIYKSNKQNFGLTVNLNLALSISQGKYIARIDADDYWTSELKLSAQVNFLEKNFDYSLIGTRAIVVNKNNKELYKLNYPTEDREIRKNMLLQNSFIHSSVLIRNKTLHRVGLYNVTNETSQDYELWLELGRRRKMANIADYWVAYRLNPAGTSLTKTVKQVNETITIIKKYRLDYPNYTKAIILWSLRKWYPSWLRGELSVKLKKYF